MREARIGSNRERHLDVESQNKAESLIAQGALTNSKRPQSFVQGVYPTHLAKGYGCSVMDTAGNRYVDFICGMGTNLLGYGHERLAVIAKDAYSNGATLSLSSSTELLLAEKVREIMPFAERIKVLKSGSEGCTAAARIARAATGRKKILSQGYNGWHDEFVWQQPPALGIANTYNLEKLANIDDVSDDIAAVILEPFITDISRARINFLADLRTRCSKTGTVLIFDETITGLRFPGYSAAAFSGVVPDMTIFGKALGGGLPISVVGGRKDIMNCGEYFVSSTFAGERVSMAVAVELIQLLQSGRYDLSRLWHQGKLFQEQFNSLIPGVSLEGYPSRGILAGEPVPKAIFMQEAVRSGLLFGASYFLSFPHLDCMDEIISTLKEVSLKIRIQKPGLDGQMPKSPFSQTMREKT